jgi:hypothetical protein
MIAIMVPTPMPPRTAGFDAAASTENDAKSGVEAIVQSKSNNINFFITLNDFNCKYTYFLFDLNLYNEVG